ncbi:MAG: MoaD/ThiS family protein [Deltaproteobacteria bacterium]|nr:MoaD/ThiS family protein [Deltaproteobacteria bacterium]
MAKKSIKVKINSSYAVGRTEVFDSQVKKGGDIIVELEPGTTVEGLLLQLPSIGSPEHWDDIMLHVFVNEEIAGFDKVLEDNDIIDLHIPVSGG